MAIQPPSSVKSFSEYCPLGSTERIYGIEISLRSYTETVTVPPNIFARAFLFFLDETRAKTSLFLPYKND